MNRIDRVTAILIQLQSKKVVRAQDIAERFGISLRTVYRDVKTLEEAGVPVIGETGIGYSIMDGYRLPPVMFTKEEATAFLTAEKLIEKFTDTSTEESYKSAMFKVKSVLRSTEKDLLEHIDEHIEVLTNEVQQRTRLKVNPIQTILKSISEKKVLSIDYFSNHKQQKTERNIEPVGIFYQGNYWHVIAFCQLRDDYRDFRIDRISKIAVTNSVFHKQHPALKSFLKRVSEEKQMETVIIRVDNEVMRYLDGQKYYMGFVSEQDRGEHTEMTFLSSYLKNFARWYVMFGDRARILQPDALKEEVKLLIEEVAKKM